MIWLGRHTPASQRNGEIRLSVALHVGIALEGGNAAGDAKSGYGTRHVQRFAGCCATQLRATLCKQQADFAEGGELRPKRHPLLATGNLVACARRQVPCGLGTESERSALGTGRGVQAARSGGTEQDGAFHEQDEVPGVDIGDPRGAAFKTVGAVCTSRDTWSILSDFVVSRTQGGASEKRIHKQVACLFLWGGELVQIKQIAEALTEIRCEVEFPICAAGAEKRWP